MTSPLLAFCLTLLLLKKMAMTASSERSISVRQETSFIAANVGDTVTLQCVFKDDISILFFWYKQSLGQEPRLISTYYKNQKATFTQEFEKEGRFSLETEPGKLHLTITNLKTADSATYYCAGKYVKMFSFGDGTFVSVRGAGTSIPASIYQSSSQTIQSGDPLTLNCTVHTGSCGGEHSVYWFGESGESHPGLIYTEGGRNDQCERKKSSTNTQTQTCVYNLPMRSLNLSQTGVYYCAVAACRQVLSGDTTKGTIKGDEDSLVLVNVLSVASAVTTLLCVCLALLVCMMNTTDSCLCGDTPGELSAPIATKDDQNTCVSDSVWKNKKIRGREQRQETRTECVYFSVKK